MVTRPDEDLSGGKVTRVPAGITVHDVPVSVREELAARAARAGRPLEDYVRSLLVEMVSLPTPEEQRSGAIP